MQNIILHDRRLRGEVEPGHGQVIQVDNTIPIAQAFQTVVRAARSSPLELVIACHGFVTHQYGGQSHEERQGGSGLQLCRENLRLSNIASVSALAGYFQRIWLMACGPGGVAVHASRPFCREFAHHANTPIVASAQVQRYLPGTHDNVAQESRPVLRFGSWEGSVYEFQTDGTVRQLTSPKVPF